ncbi:MAG: ABC transporter C-terminal domain-containing protein, partial [Clostridium sp.]|nr:ABC transporter C-terminal domain-containing protein [Clostridium sp.]
KPAAAKPEPAQRAHARKAKLSFKEQREKEQIEKDLEALSAEKKELEALFNSGAEIPGIVEKSQRFTRISEEIDEMEMRWLELEEKAQG